MHFLDQKLDFYRGEIFFFGNSPALVHSECKKLRSVSTVHCHILEQFDKAVAWASREWYNNGRLGLAKQLKRNTAQEYGS